MNQTAPLMQGTGMRLARMAAALDHGATVSTAEATASIRVSKRTGVAAAEKVKCQSALKLSTGTED